MAGEATPGVAVRIGYGEPAGRWVLAATVLGSSIAFLDATVVNIALPAIGRDLDAGVAGLTWTINAYTLALAAFVLVGGSLGDRFGRRRVFVFGVAWFGVASLACAVATGIGMLVAFRAVQGVGAALLTPGALAILQATFRAEDRSRAIGAWSGLAGIAGAVGPFLGGWMVDVGSWRWIFFLNVPVVLAVLGIAHRHVPESRAATSPGRLDLAGAGLAALGLSLITYGLSVVAVPGASAPTVQGRLVGGRLGLAGCGVRARVAAHPMLPLGILTAPRFGATNAATFLVYAALGGVFFWLVITLQVVAGWSPLTAGMALLPVTLLMLLFSPQAGLLWDRVGPRIPMTVGPLVAALGVALLTRIGPQTSYLTDVLLPVTLLGVGLTLTVAPLTSTVLGAVEESRAGLASGVNNAVARTAGLLIVAMLPALTGLGADGFSEPASLAPAFRTAMVICAVLLALGGAVAGLSIRPPEPEPRPEGPACPSRHCAVDVPPPAVADRTPT
jgi:EmrB/QacA subfamily drug resistance transporter